MSVKSILQVFILFLISLIVGGVYFKYFKIEKNLVEDVKSFENKNLVKLEEMEKKISELKLKNEELNRKLNNSQKSFNKELSESSKKVDIKIKNPIINKVNKIDNKNIIKNENSKKEIKNLVKDVEYTSVDQKGNTFNLLATSGKSNINDNNILDLENVRGKITSDFRDTIYIVSDFAQYNSVSLNSKFYENVIINYQDKEINCINFDINMETNKAIAYNDVIITDPKSIMKAGIVEFDLKTKDININPETANSEIKVITK